MEREILVSYDGEEPRVAIVEDGRLVEVHIERPAAERIVGNIYRGRVQNVLPGMQAAFVDIGIEKNAFLFVDDAYPPKGDELERRGMGERGDGEVRVRAQAGGGQGASASIQELVKEGQDILVQIAKEPTGSKGARITRHLTLPGRYLVLMPTVDYVGVSRRIEDEGERERLKALAQRIRQRHIGLVVRTAAEGRSEEDLRADWAFLRKSWLQLRKRAAKATPPALVYRDLGLVPRILRDQLNEAVTRVVVDQADGYRKLLEFLDSLAPEFKERVSLFNNGGQSLFEARGVDDEIEKALRGRVWLRSGGYLVVDQTEALTVIDVNTGKYVGSTNNLADTIFRTNLEAAQEIARQLRLRDIGGIVVIDFIDMEVPEHRRRVIQALEEACKPDHSKPVVLGLTQLGLVEMTRRKARQSLRDLLTKPCFYCEGRGRVLNEESVSRRVRHEIRRLTKNSDGDAVLIEVHPSVAAVLIGAGGANLKELERETGRTIFIRGNESCHIEQMHLRASGTRAEVEAQARPVKEGEVIELMVEEPHASNNWDGIARVDGYVIDIEGGGKKVGERVRVEITRAFRTYARAKMV